MQIIPTPTPQQSSSFHPSPYHGPLNSTPRVVSISNAAIDPLNPALGDPSPLTSGTQRRISFVSPSPDRLSFYRHVPQHTAVFSPTQSLAPNSRTDYFSHELIQSPVAYYPQFLSGPLTDSHSTPPRRSHRSSDVLSSSPPSGTVCSTVRICMITYLRARRYILATSITSQTLPLLRGTDQ